MTENTPTGDPTPVQQALHLLAADGTNAVALGTLAASEVLLPVPDDSVNPEGEEPGSLALPVFEQGDGLRLVPVFTSEERMTRALPQVRSYRTIRLATLSQGWPADDLSLSIDAGSPDTLTVQGEGVRALATLTGG
ncbi:SseB family protein [Streptomyces sp. RB6PN25]|uniref:SseB family protein n=1 Tax=Streptomyces humicola TaxID=2953240 RepID=A0ABT1Q1E0_9ACTN|nr:SseB family protein [Streptomyces humicola]MCQ4083727.1 SseB family protein [Streptomyces humicola]